MDKENTVRILVFETVFSTLIININRGVELRDPKTQRKPILIRRGEDLRPNDCQTTGIEDWHFCEGFLFVFNDRVSMSSPGCLGTNAVDQAGLKSCLSLLGLKAWTNTATTA